MLTRSMFVTLTVLLLALPAVASGQVVPHVSLPGSLIVSPPRSRVVLQNPATVMVQPSTTAGRQGIDVSSSRQITRRQGASSRSSSLVPLEVRPRLLAEARVGFGVRPSVSSTAPTPPVSRLVNSGAGDGTPSTRPLVRGAILGEFGPDLRVNVPLGDIARQLRTTPGALLDESSR